MREQWRRMRSYEGAECRRAAHVVAVSEADRGTFVKDYGVTSVSAVATGVDTDFFHPSLTEAARPSEIVFTGSMDWMPNEDGITWFVQDVLPLVRSSVNGATLSIVGRNHTAGVQALATERGGIVVTGTVPDIRPYLERAAVVIVPLRVGGGTRLKIFEAMAMERAIVSTTIGAEGLPVTGGDDIRIADDATAFAAAVVQLLRDAPGARAIGIAAAAQVRQHFGWERVTSVFADACESTLSRWRARGASGRAA